MCSINIKIRIVFINIKLILKRHVKHQLIKCPHDQKLNDNKKYSQPDQPAFNSKTVDNTDHQSDRPHHQKEFDASETGLA